MAEIHSIAPAGEIAPVPAIDTRAEFLQIRGLLRLLRAYLADRSEQHREMPSIETVQISVTLLAKETVPRIDGAVDARHPLEDDCLSLQWFYFKGVLELLDAEAWRLLNLGTAHLLTESECADLESGTSVLIDLAEQILQGLDSLGMAAATKH